MKRKTDRNDIIFLAALHPNKRGSFEDYISSLASECARNNISIEFIFGDNIASSVKHLFDESNVKYHTIRGFGFNSMKAIAKMLIEIRPKLIHLNFISPCSFLILFCRLIGIRRLILTDQISTPIYFMQPRKVRKSILHLIKYWRRRLFGLLFNRFIAVSAFVAERLITNNGVAPRKISIIYNGVNLNRFSPPVAKDALKRQLVLDDNAKFVVSYVGQLTPEKGIGVFLDAAQILLKRRKDILFLVAGNTAHTNLACERTRDGGMNGNIVFLGSRNDTEIILGASDIFVCPSIWGEAFGFVIAEAMASGVPVVASKVGGIPEVVKNNQTGMLVPPNNSIELANTINGLLENEKTRKDFAIAGRKRAEEYFSLTKMVEETIKLYQELL